MSNQATGSSGGNRRSVGGMHCPAPYWAQEALVWIGGATVAGVVGNAAYDALKAVVRRLRAVGSSDLSCEDASLIAGIALAVRCDMLELEPPNLNSLTCHAYPVKDGGWTVVFSGDQLAATVEIPPGDPTESSSTVILTYHRMVNRRRGHMRRRPTAMGGGPENH